MRKELSGLQLGKNVGCAMSDVGCAMSDIGFAMSDVQCRILETI